MFPLASSRCFQCFTITPNTSILSKNVLCSDLTVASLSSCVVYENFIGLYQDAFNNTGNLNNNWSFDFGSMT